jgi:hypothetical protein
MSTEHDVEPRRELVLRDYQRRGIDWLRGEPGGAPRNGALFLEPGLGKSAILLHAFVESGFTRCLYVAPLRVAATVPAAEASKWPRLADLHVHTVAGSASERVRALAQRRPGKNLYTIGYHSLDWLVSAINDGTLRLPRFDLVVFDESSKLKNPGTRVFKAAFGLAKYATQVVVASGTPTAQSLANIWAQIAVLDRGAALGKSYSHFLGRYFTTEGRRIVVAHASTRERIHEAVKDQVFALRAADWLELPAVQTIEREVDIDEDVRDAIDLAAEGAAFEVTLDGRRAVYPAAGNPAQAAMRAWMMTQGFIRTGAAGDYATVHDAKLDALVDLVEELDGEPLIVAHHFQFDRARILDRLADEGVTGVEIFNAKDSAELAAQITRFQSGEIRVLLAHPTAMAHGIDGLQHGGHHLAFFGQPWSVESSLQFIGRLARSGQSRPVLVHYIAVKDSLDQAIRYAIEHGATGNEALLAALAWRETTREAASGATAEDLHAEFTRRLLELRRRAQQAHPDHGGTAEEFIAVRAEMDALRAQYAATQEANT